MDERPHIIAIAEIKPKNCRYTLTEAELQLDGYTLHSCNLETDQRRGVVVYIDNSLQATQVGTDTAGDEQLWLSIRLWNHDLLLFGCIYRSPGSTEENYTQLYTSIINMCDETRYTHQLICGDFNCGEVNWATGTAQGAKAQALLDMTRESYLYQHVDRPTRVRGTDNPSLLDLVLTNEEYMVTNIEHLAPLGMSDHSVLIFNYTCYTTIPSTRVLRHQYHRGNYQAMRSDLDVDWDEMFDQCPDDPNQQLKIFTDILKTSQEKHIPKRDVTKAATTRRTPLDAKIRTEIRRKHRLWERFMRDRSDEKRLAYTRQRNRVRKLSRQAKKTFERSLAEEVKSNPKKFWRYTKSKLKTKEGVAELVHTRDDGTSVEATTDEDKAGLLADYFSSVFTIEDGTNIPDFRVYDGNIPFQDGSITPDAVYKRLKALDPTKSQGPDEIHPYILKELCTSLAYPLSRIFNTSLRTGIVPDIWKSANVSPIFKKGDRNSPKNYRPVSLTCVMCKLMEGFIRDWIMKHWYANRLLSNKQFGFVSGRSTSLQLLQVLEDWTAALDSGDNVDVVYLDFAKAFDTVPHKRLMKKLAGLGVSGRTLEWVKSFLSDRRQRVVVNKNTSSWRPVTSGVPQGSVVGPTMFVGYINDMPDCINTHDAPAPLSASDQTLLYMFADDTKIYRTIRTIADRLTLQQDLHCLRLWSLDSLLEFQPPKCRAMSLGNQDIDKPNYKLGEADIEWCTSEKDIGVTIDDKLSFDNHITNQINKATRVMGAIRRSFTYLEEHNFTLLFKALVRPHLEYAHAVWNPHLRRQINSIENVQRRATKQIPGFAQLSYSDRLKRLNLPTLAFRRLRGDVIECFKIISGYYDGTVCSGLLTRSQVTRTRGHSAKLVRTDIAAANRRHNFFTQRIVSTWNALPEHVISAPTVVTFEHRLDSHWRDHPLRWDPEYRPETGAEQRGPAGPGFRSLREVT